MKNLINEIKAVVKANRKSLREMVEERSEYFEKCLKEERENA